MLQKVGTESVLPLPEGRFRLLQLSWISCGISCEISCGISCGISYLHTSALRQGPKDGRTDGCLRFQAHVAAPDRPSSQLTRPRSGSFWGRRAGGCRLPTRRPASALRQQLLLTCTARRGHSLCHPLLHIQVNPAVGEAAIVCERRLGHGVHGAVAGAVDHAAEDEGELQGAKRRSGSAGGDGGQGGAALGPQAGP